MSTHIIPEEPGESLDIQITKVDDTIYLHHNGGTKAFSRKTVVKLLTAFSMVLHSTDRAITETTARLEAERAGARPEPQKASHKVMSIDLADLGL